MHNRKRQMDQSGDLVLIVWPNMSATEGYSHTFVVGVDMKASMNANNIEAIRIA